MGIGIDAALGIHDDALALHARRTRLLAANLANADTPGYKAQDIDFRSVLERQLAPRASLTTTHAQHLPTATGAQGAEPDVLYRIPSQPSLDGNTVDAHREKAAFAESSLRYQTSLQLLDRRLRGLMTALRGE